MFDLREAGNSRRISISAYKRVINSPTASSRRRLFYALWPGTWPGTWPGNSAMRSAAPISSVDFLSFHRAPCSRPSFVLRRLLPFAPSLLPLARAETSALSLSVSFRAATISQRSSVELQTSYQGREVSPEKFMSRVKKRSTASCFPNDGASH